MQLLRVLWNRNGEATLRDIADDLKGAGNTIPAGTLSAAIRHAIARGHVRVADDRKPFRYAAVTSQDDTFKSLANDLLNRVFGGSVKRLVLAALGERKPSEAEIAEMKEMIRDAATKRAGTSTDGGKATPKA